MVVEEGKVHVMWVHTHLVERVGLELLEESTLLKVAQEPSWCWCLVWRCEQTNDTLPRGRGEGGMQHTNQLISSLQL